MNKNLIASLIGVLTLISIQNANAAESRLRYSLVAGNALDRNHTDVKRLPPSSNIRKLPYRKGSSGLVQEAKNLVTNKGNVALMVIQDGAIVFENYKRSSSKDTKFFSASMAKSLTAYTLGQQLCDGRIRSLNDPIGTYAPDIAFTFYKNIEIYNSLRMASGHAKPTGGRAHTLPKTFQKLTKTNQIEMMDLFRVASQSAPQGTKFRYHSHDTASLERVIANTAHEPNMVDEFRRNLWSKIGAGNHAFWLTDRNGTPLSFGGFYATMPDWARLALWSVDRIKENSCLGDYMRQATVKQSRGRIQNDTPKARAFDGYGFQTWLRNGQFWWVGYGGQRVGVDPRRNRIIIVFSTAENYMREVYELMDY
jgi:CubicO group peptidase (beta-lactamase class C family)